MDKQERFRRESEDRKNWKQIREKKEKFCELLVGKDKLMPYDTLLFYTAASVILESLTLKEDKLIDAPNRIEGIEVDGEDKIEEVRQKYGDIAPEILCFLISEDEKTDGAKRLEALEKLQIIAWKALFDQKEQLEDLCDRFSETINKEDMVLIFQCLSLVVLELDFQDTEVEILESMYD